MRATLIRSAFFSLAAPVAVLALGGCSRSSGNGEAAKGSGGEKAAASASAVPGAGGGGGARFSRPIAAVHLADGATIVAGLVVPSSSVLTVRIGKDGAEGAAKPALSDVTWSGGVELHAMAAPEGAAIVWRGSRAGKNVTQMVRVGAQGDPRGQPTDIGSAACTTDDAIAWLDRGAGGTTRVRTLPWAGGAVSDVLTLPADRDPELVCGARGFFALAGGEDDMTVAWARGAQTGALGPFLRDKDFPKDEEREHDAYTVGDSLGLVRMGDSGALAVREAGFAGPGPWRALTTKLAPDDDIVAVDGDAQSLVVVFTHEDGQGCDGAGSSTVRAIRVSRAAVEAGVSAPEQQIDLAAPVCDRDPGPFWTGSIGGAMVVGWAERGHASAKTSASSAPSAKAPEGDAATRSAAGNVAPISGFSYRVLPDELGTAAQALQRKDLSSDELVFAGCDKERCSVVSLVRPPGEDGMQPEAVRAIAFP